MAALGVDPDVFEELALEKRTDIPVIPTIAFRLGEAFEVLEVDREGCFTGDGIVMVCTGPASPRWGDINCRLVEGLIPFIAVRHGKWVPEFGPAEVMPSERPATVRSWFIDEERGHLDGHYYRVINHQGPGPMFHDPIERYDVPPESTVRRNPFDAPRVITHYRDPQVPGESWGW